jgi:hypothetical protein
MLLLRKNSVFSESTVFHLCYFCVLMFMKKTVLLTFSSKTIGGVVQNGYNSLFYLASWKQVEIEQYKKLLS